MRTSHGRRPPPTAARLGTMAVARKAMPPSSMGRPITGAVDGAARPMTAVRAAGYRGKTRSNLLGYSGFAFLFESIQHENNCSALLCTRILSQPLQVTVYHIIHFAKLVRAGLAAWLWVACPVGFSLSVFH